MAGNGYSVLRLLSRATINNKLLIVSTYFQTKGGADIVMDYQDCLDQLYEIFQKCQTTNHIVIGGDLNVDL